MLIYFSPVAITTHFWTRHGDRKLWLCSEISHWFCLDFSISSLGTAAGSTGIDFTLSFPFLEALFRTEALCFHLVSRVAKKQPSYNPCTVGDFSYINHVSNSDSMLFFPSKVTQGFCCSWKRNPTVNSFCFSIFCLVLPARPMSLQDLGICKPQNLIKSHTAQQHALFLNDSEGKANRFGKGRTDKYLQRNTKGLIACPTRLQFCSCSLLNTTTTTTITYVGLKFMPLFLQH